MKTCYECFKEIGVDVDEIWGKISDFGVSIGLLPLIWIVLCKWTPITKFSKEIGVDVQSDMKEIVVF